MFISAVLGSYGIGSTVSGYLFVQSARYRQALIDLADTHHQLTYAHRLLAERVRRDGMTGMLNRTTFVAELEKYAENREPGALLIIDADHFKVINDSYGHLAGDAALLSIVEAITVATDERAAAARLGGEEFGVFLAGDDMRAALRAAERIRRAVAAIDFRPNGTGRVPLSVSIGMEILRGDWTVEAAIRNADRRLYEAKATGRDRVVTDSCEAVAA